MHNMVSILISSLTFHPLKQIRMITDLPQLHQYIIVNLILSLSIIRKQQALSLDHLNIKVQL